MGNSTVLRAEDLSAPDPGPIFVSLETAADSVSVSHWLLRKKIRLGELEQFRMKNSPIIRVRLNDVIALFEAQSGPSGAMDGERKERARKQATYARGVRSEQAKAKQDKSAAADGQ